jgi:hypothetical protein
MNLHLPMHPLCRLNEARPPVGSGLEIDYVIRDARKWVVDPKRTASEFDAGYIEGCWRRPWVRRHLFIAHMLVRNESV